MLSGFLKLTWVEMKVFLREPMGVVGSLVMPVVVFVALGRATGTGRFPGAGTQLPFTVPVLAGLLIPISAVLSLIAIMAIYRESGILKRLRATPLSPITILSSHVAVKLVFTSVSLVLLFLAGRSLFPDAVPVDALGFVAALLLGTLSILSTGFVIASLVPTARFAQPIGAALFYPMIALSGLFVPVQALPAPMRIVAHLLPTTHAAALMQGAWIGTGWGPNWPHAVALVVIGIVSVGVAARVFRWE